MATANDSIYVNIIAKTHDAIHGINNFAKAITLAGSGFYAFRTAIRLAGQGIEFLRSQNKDLDESLKRVKSAFDSSLSQSLRPFAEGLRDIADAFAEVVDRSQYTARQLDEVSKRVYDRTVDPLQKQKDAVEALFKAWQAAVETAERAKLPSFTENVITKAGPHTPAITQKIQIQPDPLMIRATEEQAKAAKIQYDSAKMLLDAMNKPTGGTGGGVQPQRFAIFTDYDANILAEIEAMRMEDTPLIRAAFSDFDTRILEEIAALRDEDEPWLKLFRDDDTEVLKELAALKDEELTAISDEYKRIVGYIASATESLVSGDIAGALRGVGLAIWNEMVVPYCIAAAASAAAVQDYVAAVFWLGLAGVGAGLIGSIGSSGGGQGMPNSTPAYPIYSGSGRSITVVNNIGGSVITERHMAAVTAKYMSEY